MLFGLPRGSVLLVVGAHPDDFEIMAGGTLVRWNSEKRESYAMVMSDGELSGEPRVRRRETEKAAEILGVKEVFFCGLPDGRISHSIETISPIEEKIKELKPAVLITHNPDDTHQDHRNVGMSCISAARRHPRVLMGETPSTIARERYVSVDISDYMKLKMRALRMHRSQHRRLGNLLLDWVTASASLKGREIGVKYAEIFWVWRFADLSVLKR
jgi:LmbE family N-acetylglucosaminyl deacetylase